MNAPAGKMTADRNHKLRTLWLAGALHAFTHMYHVALLPLYLLIQKDFQLRSKDAATLLVTMLMLAYFVPSYLMGVLADKVSRKKLLAWGLVINAAGFVGLACAPGYRWAIASMLVAGFGGSFYHPAATAMVARLFPVGTGKALGLAGIGAGVGFFVSPIYTGWRAHALEATLGAAAWRRPVFELGLLGLVAAGLFAWLADEEAPLPAAQRESRAPDRMFPSPALWVFFLGASFAFSLRDFTGNSMGTLGSLFLQQAHGFNPARTGLALSGIYLAGAFGNPLFGHLSDRGRLRWTSLALLIAALMVALFPHLPRAGLNLAFMIYGFFFMSSYPMVEAALMESVPDSVRGRVFGFFITIGGLVGNLSHWIIGRLVDGLGAKGSSPEAYFTLYALLALLVVLSLGGLPCLHAIRKREHLELPAEPSRAGPAIGQPKSALQ